MVKAVIYVIQSSNGLIWGAAFDSIKAQAEIERLEEIYDDTFYITTTDVLDINVRR